MREPDSFKGRMPDILNHSVRMKKNKSKKVNGVQQCVENLAIQVIHVLNFTLSLPYRERIFLRVALCDRLSRDCGSTTKEG
jgi:hypothetical protein